MLQEIQKFDYDRYLSAIFAPRDKRDDIASIILFNLEIARIRSKVTEPMMGLIRLQWWREAIDEIFDPVRTPRRHNVVSTLRDLTQKYKLDKNDCLGVINAREKDMDETPFKTMAEFNDYLLNTTYPINKMMLDVLGVNNEGVISAAKHISLAWGLCAIVRSASRNFSVNRQVFPADLMKKHKLDISDFGKPEFVKNSKALVKELYELAETELARAEQLLKFVPKPDKKPALPVLLSINTTKNHLKQIKKNKFDIFTQPLDPYLGIFGLVSIYLRS